MNRRTLLVSSFGLVASMLTGCAAQEKFDRMGMLLYVPSDLPVKKGETDKKEFALAVYDLMPPEGEKIVIDQADGPHIPTMNTHAAILNKGVISDSKVVHLIKNPDFLSYLDIVATQMVLFGINDRGQCIVFTFTPTSRDRMDVPKDSTRSLSWSGGKTNFTYTAGGIAVSPLQTNPPLHNDRAVFLPSRQIDPATGEKDKLMLGMVKNYLPKPAGQQGSPSAKTQP